MNMTRNTIGATFKDIDHVFGGDLLIDLYPNRIPNRGSYKVFEAIVVILDWIQKQ